MQASGRRPRHTVGSDGPVFLVPSCLCCIPADCFAPYENEYEFTLPQGNSAFSHEQILKMLPGFDGYFNIGTAADKPIFDAAKKMST
jgi:hypothetical protein